MRKLTLILLLLLFSTGIANGQKTPGSDFDHVGQAMAYRNNGNLENAIVEFTKAIEIDQRNTLAYYNRARVRQSIKDFDGAIADYSKAAEIEPELTNAYHGRATAKWAKGNLDGAIADISRCIEIDPDDAALYYQERGEARFAKDDYHGAIADFSKVIEIDPRSVIAYNLRGTVESQTGNISESVADFYRAIELDNVRQGYYTAALYCNLALALREKGDLNVALVNFDRSMKFFPDFAGAYAGRGLVYFELSKEVEAKQDFDRALVLDPSLKSLLNRETEKLRQRTRVP